MCPLTVINREQHSFVIESDIFELIRRYPFRSLLEKGGFYLDKNIPSVKELRTIGFIRKTTLHQEFY